MKASFPVKFLMAMCLSSYYVPAGLGQHTNMENLNMDVSGNELVSYLYSKDSSFMNPVILMEEESGKLYYSCTLRTPVCSDTLCQVVLLILSWDLAGYYIKFDTIAGYPLTKYDHKPFTSEDYLKLQAALGNLNSVLGRKTEKDLLDSSSTRYSEKIDGVTGATALQIRDAVVDGALYSTYTLWHLVNGPIRESLINHTLHIYSPTIEKQMMESSNPLTVILALKQWGPIDYDERFDEIIETMGQGHPLVNFFIAKNLPPEVLERIDNQLAIQRIWEHLDSNVRSIFLDFIDAD